MVPKLIKKVPLFGSKKEMSDLYVKAVVGRGSFGLVKLVYHKRDKCLGLPQEPCEVMCFQQYGRIDRELTVEYVILHDVTVIFGCTLTNHHLLLASSTCLWLAARSRKARVLLLPEAEVLCPEMYRQEASGAAKARKVYALGAWDQQSMLSPLHHALHHHFPGAPRIHELTEGGKCNHCRPGCQERLLLDRVLRRRRPIHSHPWDWESQQTSSTAPRQLGTFLLKHLAPCGIHWAHMITGRWLNIFRYLWEDSWEDHSF